MNDAREHTGQTSPPGESGGKPALPTQRKNGTDAQQNLAARLRSAARYVRCLLDASLDPMLVIDMQRRIVDVNRAAEEITGLQRHQFLGKDLAGCFAQGEQVIDLVLRAFHDGPVHGYPLSIQHETGKKTEVSCSVTIYRNEDGQALGAFIVARDVTDLRQYERQMSFQATCDVLTALPNRMLFRERLWRAMKHADRNCGAVGLMFIDLDNFKDVNDTLGHAIGDELLKGTANYLTDALQTADTVARMGGDEFAVLIEDAGDIDEIECLAYRLRNAIAKSHIIDGHEVTISCSIGITLYPFDGADVDTLLRNADAAMYRAKEDGKNTCRHFSPEMNDAIRRRVDIGNCLRRAIKVSEFALHYQPRADLADGRITGAEALIRWHSHDLGPVSPSEFIPIAENNGMIVQIGEWVLHQACHQAVHWQQTMGAPISIAVNLSARQFRDVDIARAVACALDRSGLPPRLLELELTESTLMHDVKRVLRTFDALKEIGVRLAVDDFGTGYSSLSYLKSFPLDYLKVDRSFINDIPRNSSDKTIVRAIIAMAHSLGLKVIAEGVETMEQLGFLMEQRCDEIQGYYFSRPLPQDELESLLAKRCRLELGNQ